jgi:hypothetical protein
MKQLRRLMVDFLVVVTATLNAQVTIRIAVRYFRV